MTADFNEQFEKMKKLFSDIFELNDKTSKTSQEFLLKLHTAIKHQYMNFSKTRKEISENWRSIQEEFETWGKAFENLLLEKREV
ncbi:MAG: hypothetical protein LDL53_01370, partial [Candidatus Hydrogenedens sp.]|nr:hypothetical protein [Candidatus Hydrogenedens sp.]